MARTACTEPQCLYKGALYFTVELYLYSPYGPYGLYRAPVSVQGCTLPNFTYQFILRDPLTDLIAITESVLAQSWQIVCFKMSVTAGLKA